MTTIKSSLFANVFKKIRKKHGKITDDCRKKFGRVKCDCGHYMKDHFAEKGCCNKCGCTWYYPNVKYILRKKKEKIK